MSMNLRAKDLKADYATIMNLRRACEKAEGEVGRRSAGVDGTILFLRRITEAALVAEYRCLQELVEHLSPGMLDNASAAGTVLLRQTPARRGKSRRR